MITLKWQATVRGRALSLAYWLFPFACELIELRRSSLFLMLKCPFDCWDEIVELDVDTVTVKRTLLRFKFSMILLDVVSLFVAVVVVVIVVMSDICELDWVSGLSKSPNVFATDLRTRDCLSDGAIVPLRVNLHWNNSCTRKLLLSITNIH